MSEEIIGEDQLKETLLVELFAFMLYSALSMAENHAELKQQIISIQDEFGHAQSPFKEEAREAWQSDEVLRKDSRKAARFMLTFAGDFGAALRSASTPKLKGFAEWLRTVPERKAYSIGEK